MQERGLGTKTELNNKYKARQEFACHFGQLQLTSEMFCFLIALQR
jgi:hypothetical protein